MPELYKHFKIILPLGGALAFAGVAGFLFYKLLHKDHLIHQIYLASSHSPPTHASGRFFQLNIDDTKTDEDECENEKIPIFKLTKSELKIPKSAVGIVIGRQGANIKQIQATTSTTINFGDEGEKERTCIIKGQLEKVEMAKELILKYIEDIPVTESMELHVPCEAVGSLIGRNGTTIHSMQRITGAKINVHSEGSFNAGEPESTRRVVMKGTVEQLKAAEAIILKKVEEELQRRKEIMNSVSHISQRSSRARHRQNGDVHEMKYSERESREAATFSQSISNKTYNEVFVSAVDTATHFWVQIIGSKTVELDRLVSQMTDFYNENAKFHIPDKILEDDIVAARFPHDDMWYRGRVSSPCEPDSPLKTVYFVDFGDTDEVDTAHICELRTDFLTLSFQAIECYLANIDPESANSPECLEDFHSLTHATLWEPVMVRVLGYKQEGLETLPFVRIVDTSGPQDVDVAEELVKRGLAEWTDVKFATSLSSSRSSLTEQPASV